jgi:spore germination protein YaaH
MRSKPWIVIGTMLAVLITSTPVFAAGVDKTTKYRVYQNNHILTEWSNYNQALSYAKGFAFSHVEEIGTRKWLWNNLPHYVVYQNGATDPNWQFTTLDAAMAEAKNWNSASIRDTGSGGWVWNNYTRYEVYQGDKTMSGWRFTTLESAITEAKRWGGSHIIDLENKRWVWDNFSAAAKDSLRKQAPAYQVYQGMNTKPEWQFAYAEDAVNEALKWGNSTVVNLSGNVTVWSNARTYQVYQNDKLINAFVGLNESIAYAKQFAHSSIKLEGREIWSSAPFYQVYQNDSLVFDFNSLDAALQNAAQYSNASIRTPLGQMLWDNFRKLEFWGWNGSSNDTTIRSHVAITTGLDVDSPTYFNLSDAQGNLTDTSNADTVKWLKSQGYKVYPLVHNQFDAAMTSQFLTNPLAQDLFISSLISKLTAIGADGVNVDFESLNGKDRDAYTAFISKLTAAAHASKLYVSMDLPRGDTRWDSRSAYDHEKLSAIVDAIVIMAYDQYWKGSESPGSVSGLQWTEQGIQDFLSYGVQRDKLLIGIPYYVREWQLDATGKIINNRAVFMKDIPDLIASTGATTTWDSTYNQYRVDYQKDGSRYVFWLENEDTVKARLALAKKYDLAGVAAWRLGYDTADLWKMMLQQK